MNGNCSWRVTVEGDFEDLVVSVAPQRTIRGTAATDGVRWKCDVEGNILLYTIFTVYGKPLIK